MDPGLRRDDDQKQWANRSAARWQRRRIPAFVGMTRCQDDRARTLRSALRSNRGVQHHSQCANRRM